MAGVIDRVLDMFKLSDNYDDDDDEFDEYDDDGLNVSINDDDDDVPSRGRHKKKEREFEDYNLKEEASENPARKSNVVPMPGKSGKNMEVCVIKPASMEDSKEIVDTLLKGRAVVINLEGIHIETAQRIIDFTFGACYSIEGNLNKVTEYIFIVTPSNIELTGDLLDVLAGESFDSSSFKL